MSNFVKDSTSNCYDNYVIMYDLIRNLEDFFLSDRDDLGVKRSSMIQLTSSKGSFNNYVDKMRC